MSSGVEVAQRNDTSPAMRDLAIIPEYPIDPIHREFLVHVNEGKKLSVTLPRGRVFFMLVPESDPALRKRFPEFPIILKCHFDLRLRLQGYKQIVIWNS